jgi:membrane fusion protein (multidrug efflux system)
MNDQQTKSEMPLAPVTGMAREPLDPVAPPRVFPWLWMGIRLFVLVLVAGLIAMVAREWEWWVGSAVQQTTDDAYLEADLTPVAAKVAGYIRRVPVQDFQRVKAGDLLIEIVDDDYRAQLDQARGNVAVAQAAIVNIEQQKLLQKALIAQAEAMIQASEADFTRYHLERVRQQTLLAKGIAGTPQITEQAIDNEEHAAATLSLNRAQLDQQRQQLNVLESQMQQARATLEVQQAAYKLAEINLGYTRITAPVNGMVGRRMVRAGQYIGVGTQVNSLVPLPNVWVIANYKETQMTRVRVGQRARLTVDAFPGTVLHGRVDSWSPASGAQFSLLPPDNATGNFTKVVQRIPVKIVLDPNPTIGDLLRPGMSVIATIDTNLSPPVTGVDTPKDPPLALGDEITRDGNSSTTDLPLAMSNTGTNYKDKLETTTSGTLAARKCLSLWQLASRASSSPAPTTLPRDGG